MKVIVGLGNPGPKYETTRHNVGFLAVDRLIDRWKAEGPVNKFGGEIYQATRKNEKILLVKPGTFMNLSGRCVGPLTGFYKCSATDLIVIHDDLDLTPLSIRIKTGGGSGGHNGLKSIDEGLGQNGYHRIRIGIGKAGGTPAAPVFMDAADYVLQRFPDEELASLDQVLDRVTAAAERMIEGDVTAAMNEFNRR